MKKRGFTLIEIIISVSLIAIIGTISIVSIISLRKAKVENLLESNSKVLNNALEVYLEKHPEVTNNVNNNFKGAVVTLQVLKDEGLIDIKGLSKDAYEENYYFLSNSVLADGSTAVSDANKECDNNILSVQTVSSWNLKNLDKSKIIYICPTSGSGSTTTDLVNVKNYVARGEKPNNYVELSVKSDDTQWAYFPENDYNNLWRIVSIEDGKIKLMYDGTIVTDNYVNYYGNTKPACRLKKVANQYPAYTKEELGQSIGNAYCNIKYNCYGRHDTNGTGTAYFKYSGQKNWSSSEILSDFSGHDMKAMPNSCYTKKRELLRAIEFPGFNDTKLDTTNGEYKESKEFYAKYIEKYAYSVPLKSSTSSDNTKDTNLDMYLGLITKNDILKAEYNGSSWLEKFKEYAWTQVEKYYEAVDSGTGYDENNRGPFNFYTIGGHEYTPVIVLKNSIKLQKNNNCLVETNGTLSCPYKLDFSAVK